MTETKPQVEPKGPPASQNVGGGETSMPSESPPEGMDVSSSNDNASSELLGIGAAAPSIDMKNWREWEGAPSVIDRFEAKIIVK